MKTTLTFNSPDDDHSKHCALRGTNYLAAIQEFDRRLRMKIKYGSGEKMALASASELREVWYEVLNDERIDLTEELP